MLLGALNVAGRVKVVDNNVDLESEDDNDSESPEAAAGETDTAAAAADMDTCPAMPQQSPDSPTSGHHPTRNCVREPTCEEPSTSRPTIQNRGQRVGADGGPEEKGMNDTNPWAKAEWEEGEDESPADSTAWGKLVGEMGSRGQGDEQRLERQRPPLSDDAIGASHEGMDTFLRSNPKEMCVSGDDAGWAAQGTRRKEHGRQCSKATSNGMVEVTTTGSLAATAAATSGTTGTTGKGVAKAHPGQPTSVSKRERRRHTAARGSKTLFLTNGDVQVDALLLSTVDCRLSTVDYQLSIGDVGPVPPISKVDKHLEAGLRCFSASCFCHSSVREACLLVPRLRACECVLHFIVQDMYL